jgi:hypothetical protein
MNLPTRHLMLVLPLVAAIAACDSISGGSDTETLSLSFAVTGTGSTSNAMMASVVDPVTLNGHTIDLQSADVVFTDIRLDRVDSNDDGDSDAADSDDRADSDSENDDDEEETLRLGAATVTLPLDGGVVTPITANIPDGTFESIELKISTIRLRGLFDGAPFDVTLVVNTEIEQDFSPLLVIDSDDDHPNVTIEIDTSKWFINNGSLINPNLLATNATLRDLLRAQIRSSFKAFEDSDRDGDDQDSDSDGHDRDGHD